MVEVLGVVPLSRTYFSEKRILNKLTHTYSISVFSGNGFVGINVDIYNHLHIL